MRTERCAIRRAGAEVLSDEGRGRVCHPPRRKEREDEDAHPDGVARERVRTERREDADETEPTRRLDERLEALRETRRAMLEKAELQCDVPPRDRDATLSRHQPKELVADADAAPEVRRDSRANDAESMERANPEDENRREHDVEPVREPERSHRCRSITCGAEDRVLHEEEEHRDVPTEHNGRVERALACEGVTRTDRAEDLRGERCADHAEDRRNGHCRHDDVERGARSSLLILLADAACDRGRRTRREAHRHGVDERRRRLRHADDRDRARPEAGDEEDIHDCEQRLHAHFEHHRDREEDHRAPDGDGREIADRPPDGVAQGREERRGARIVNA